MQNNTFMTYDESAGVKAGGSGLSEGGAHVCDIVSAKYKEAGTGSKGIEFSLDVGGLKANYITLYYAKADGSPIKGGSNALQAIMGILGLQKTTMVQSGEDWVVSEFTGKKIGLFLQKRLFTKSDGGDGYGFDIRVPFDAQTRQTLREKVESKQAQTIESMSKSYKDQDDTTQQPAQGGYTQAGPDVGDGQSW